MQKILIAILFFVGLSASTATFAEGSDLRYASISCEANVSTAFMNCDYRYAPTIVVKDLFLKINGKAVQIPEKGITNYPAEGQTTKILFLVDISDPSRQNTVEKTYVRDISEMLSSKKPYEDIGLAAFDSDMELLVPISSNGDATLNALSSIKATGYATEFYKNILAAIDVLKKTEGTRKGLIILSDGKDEDKAYKSEDVVKAAKDANVSILALGYSEKPSDTPYLQTLKKLADETFGVYINVSGKKLPLEFLEKPFSFVENGGQISFDGNSFRGVQSISLEMNTNSSELIIVTTNADFSKGRGYGRQAIDFLKYFWWVVVIGVFGVIFLFFAVKRYLTRIKPTITEYAFLDEMSGAGTKYPLVKTANRIGRSSDNDIQLSNDSISSHHAEIHRRREGEFYIVDLASKNGIYVNEQKVSQTELQDGDLIELGEVRLHFTIN